MEAILEFIEKLVEEMEETEWTIEKIVTGEKEIINDVNFLKVNGLFYEESDGLYIKQWTGYCGDDYYGVIYYPIKDNKYLKINYRC